MAVWGRRGRGRRGPAAGAGWPGSDGVGQFREEDDGEKAVRSGREEEVGRLDWWAAWPGDEGEGGVAHRLAGLGGRLGRVGRGVEKGGGTARGEEN